MTIQSLFGAISIGKDTSGNFKHSFKGLAVRATPEGKFIAYDGEEFIDVTDLTIEGGEGYIYRLPVKMPQAGDLIIRSDNPFSVLFVEKVLDKHGAHIEGFDPATNTCVEYCPPANPLGCRFFIKVVSIMGRLFKQGEDICDMLPLMALLGQGGAAGGVAGNDILTPLLLMQSMGGKTADDRLALMLLLQGNKTDSLQSLLLAEALGGGSGLFGSLLGHHGKSAEKGKQ